MLRLALLVSASVLGSGTPPAWVASAVEPPGEVADDNEQCDPPEPGFLTLDTAPWTQVYVDGEYAGSTPLYRYKLAPGAHTLSLVNEGRDVKSEEKIDIEEGHIRKLKLILSVDENAAALDDTGAVTMSADDCFIPEDQAAALSIDTQPWSRVYIDGKSVGSTPLFRSALAAGPHVVRLVRDDGKSAFARFTASAGETVKLSLSLGQ